MAEEEIKKMDWVKMKPADLQKIVVELYNNGESTAQIGLILRDKYGIPKAKLLGKKITAILKDAGVEIRSEKEVVQARVDKLKSHLERNKHDQPTKKKLIKELWAVKRASS